MTQHTASGDGAPSSAPPSIGAHYTDTSTGNQYLSKGTASAADWIKQQRSIAPITTEDPFFDIDPAQSTLYITTLNSNTAPTIGTADAGTRVDVIMTQDEAGHHTVTWPDSIDWLYRTFGEVARYPNQVTRISLWSLGGGRWVGEANTYGAPVLPLYAAAWQDTSGLVYLSVADSSGKDVFLNGVVLQVGKSNFMPGYAAAAVSKDCRWAALTVGNGLDNRLIIWDLNNGEYREVAMTLGGLSATGVRLQFHGGYLWGRSDDGFFRINPSSGETESMVIDAQATPQEWFISGENITLNFNNTTGANGSQQYPARTYNLATGLLAEVQFPLPDGSLLDTGTAGPPSPFGAAGAYSPDGAHYALCAQMAFGESLENAVPKTVLTVYEVSTNIIAHTIEIPLYGSSDSIVTWSYGGRYVAVIYGNAAGSNDGTLAAILDMQEGTHSLVSDEAGAAGKQAIIMDDGVLVTSDGYNFKTAAHAQSGASAIMPGWAKTLLDVDDNGYLVNTVVALASNGATSE